jgi:hypothetical protein
MVRLRLLTLCCVLLVTVAVSASAQEWAQWAQNQNHTGIVNVTGQSASHMLADIVYDPFVAQEKADHFAAGDLQVHYQAPILEGDNLYMEFKSGNFTSIDHWESQTWNEERLHWENGQLVQKWTFASDWKPAPFSLAANGPFWEPVYHAALSGNYLYVPAAGGAIVKLDKLTGALVSRISPFGNNSPHTFTVGPLTVDTNGNVYYDVMKLAPNDPWTTDIVNSWLVKVAPNGTVNTATYTSLTPGAPAGTDQCLGVFSTADFPWPPSPTAVPGTITCGSQRPGLNQAPAVGPDGTIYVVSTAQLSSRTAYLVAVNPNLTPKWKASLRDRFNDGCNVLLPPNGQPDGCRTGATTGVDPAQNRPGGGRVIDDSTSSVVVLPDGSLLYGAYTGYNYSQGHLMKFSSTGQFLAAYPFGWDDTPAVVAHDGTYSILSKDNHYGDTGSYCDDDTFCPPDRTTFNPAYPEAYFFTRLNANLGVEWQYQNTNTLSCNRAANGSVTCQSDHPVGFEWCVNAPAIDNQGVVYANSEDGNLYTLNSNGQLRDNLFLQQALGAAYTPVSLDQNGRIYTQNDGHLFVVGN